MNSFKELYDSDMHRYGSNGARGYARKFCYYFRKSATCKNKILKRYYCFMFHSICTKHGLEIAWQTKIGKGLYVGHPYNITINPEAILGKNINIHKGVTIGQ